MKRSTCLLAQVTIAQVDKRKKGIRVAGMYGGKYPLFATVAILFAADVISLFTGAPVILLAPVDLSSFL